MSLKFSHICHVMAGDGGLLVFCDGVWLLSMVCKPCEYKAQLAGGLRTKRMEYAGSTSNTLEAHDMQALFTEACAEKSSLLRMCCHAMRLSRNSSVKKFSSPRRACKKGNNWSRTYLLVQFLEALSTTRMVANNVTSSPPASLKLL